MVDRGQNKKGKPNMTMVIEGKLLYLKMVKGEKNSTYSKLKKRFDNLTINWYEPKMASISEVKESDSIYTSRINENANKGINNQEILDLIFEKGLDEAMKLYSE